MGQIIGLKAVHAGNPLPKGVKDAESFCRIFHGITYYVNILIASA